jgi:hypothetical protein
MVTQTKLCVDCKHYEPSKWREGPCLYGSGVLQGHNIVTGEAYHSTSSSIRIMRMGYDPFKEGECGLEGKLWEPKVQGAEMDPRKEDVTVQFDPSFFDKLRSWFVNKE